MLCSDCWSVISIKIIKCRNLSAYSVFYKLVFNCLYKIKQTFLNYGGDILYVASALNTLDEKVFLFYFIVQSYSQGCLSLYSVNKSKLLYKKLNIVCVNLKLIHSFIIVRMSFMNGCHFLIAIFEWRLKRHWLISRLEIYA